MDIGVFENVEKHQIVRWLCTYKHWTTGCPGFRQTRDMRHVNAPLSHKKIDVHLHVLGAWKKNQSALMTRDDMLIAMDEVQRHEKFICSLHCSICSDNIDSSKLITPPSFTSKNNHWKSPWFHWRPEWIGWRWHWNLQQTLRCEPWLMTCAMPRENREHQTYPLGDG